MQTTRKRPERAIVVGVITPATSAAEAEDSLSELALLADTAGAVVTDRVVQSLPRLNPSTCIGTGKVAEIAELVQERGVELVMFDDDLTRVQLRNLEIAFGCKIVDRSGLILDIFARRAKTATAKTQVELAQLEYQRTRLTRQWTHLSRQQGGIGTRGPGETQIETDRRQISRRIATLKERLRKIGLQRSMQRQGRERYTRVSLVGYTNAGKSTLLNALSGSKVEVEDRLFATLDATTRLVRLSRNKPVLMADTVGFIRKLPHNLIESFKSTLDEVRQSDVLLHVVNVTQPRFQNHIRVVRETLKEIGALDRPTLMVFNKVDALPDHSVLAPLGADWPEAAFVSALREIGLDDLKTRLLACIEQDFVERTAIVPLSEAKAIFHIHRVTDVLSEEYLYARGGTAVARLRFRAAREHFRDLAPILERWEGLRPA